MPCLYQNTLCYATATTITFPLCISCSIVDDLSCHFWSWPDDCDECTVNVVELQSFASAKSGMQENRQLRLESDKEMYARRLQLEREEAAQKAADANKRCALDKSQTCCLVPCLVRPHYSSSTCCFCCLSEALQGKALPRVLPCYQAYWTAMLQAVVQCGFHTVASTLWL